MEALEAWIEKELRASLLRKRGYPHFDPKIRFQSNIHSFKKFFADERNVAKHSFYPFIQMSLITPRYKRTGALDPRGKPIREISKKERLISYAAHFDSFIYSFYSSILNKLYEEKIKEQGISDNVIAYVKTGESNIEFALEVFNYIASKGECSALAFDITGFFDRLDHLHLKKMWATMLGSTQLPADHFKLYKTLTNYAFVRKEDLEQAFPYLKQNTRKGLPNRKICEPLEFREKVRKAGLIKKNGFKNENSSSPQFGKQCGIPQGSPISACLSNIYMLDFDMKVQAFIGSINGLYRRYCDDIIVVVDTKDEPTAKAFIEAEIQKYELQINSSKTEITIFRKHKINSMRAFASNGKHSNLQYLGFEFNGENIYIRSSSMSRYYRRMTSRINGNLKAAYGKNAIGNFVFKRTLFNRYSDKGERNFITYAQRAGEIMNSDSIRKQHKNSMLKVSKKYRAIKLRFEAKRRPKKIMK